MTGKGNRPITQKMPIYLYVLGGGVTILPFKKKRDYHISTKIYSEKPYYKLWILMVCNRNDVRVLVTNVQMFVLPY